MTNTTGLEQQARSDIRAPEAKVPEILIFDRDAMLRDLKTGLKSLGIECVGACKVHLPTLVSTMTTHLLNWVIVSLSRA